MHTAAQSGEKGWSCDWHGDIFRLNPDCELLQLHQLPQQQQERLIALEQDAGFYGVLLHRSGIGLSTKAVSRDTAALLSALQQPGRLNDLVAPDRDAQLAITRLLYDGVLQVRQDAEWICGPAACSREKASGEQSGPLAQLSLEALQHAARLRVLDTAELCGHLYRYNTLPLTPSWLRRIPDETAIAEYLQIQPGGRNGSELDRDWRQVPLGPEQRSWMAWTSRTAAMPTGITTYKLYLSPLPPHLREAFTSWVRVTTATGALHFKIGADVRGLLRPDKMVAYFADLDALAEAAHLLTQDLSGCPAQGVPFTAELNCGALISWGSDPPLEEAVPSWLRQQSWRQWVCNRLGAALAVAKQYPSDAVPAWHFALERLRLDGVDVGTWTATAAHLQARPGNEVAAV